MKKTKNMQEGPVRIVFAALQIPSPPEIDLHITIARRYDAIDADIRAMQHDLERLIRPHLPVGIEFGNFCFLGEKGTFPAYKVKVADPAIQSLLQRYHDKYYKEAPGKAMYPKLKFHVTVDTPEKRAFYENMMRSHERSFFVHDTLFRTTTKGAEPMIADGKWTCPDCKTQNPMDQKECGSAHCDQWRPKPAFVKRDGDWQCIKCGVENFAGRAACMKCGFMKVDQLARAAQYEMPPAAPSAPPAQQLQPLVAGGRKPDWFCPACRFTVFGSKAACRGGMRNPN